MMQVNIGGHILPIEHKTMMGSLTDLWKIGNGYRLAKGLPALDLSNWIRSPEVYEYVKVVEKDVLGKSSEPTDLRIVNSVLSSPP